MEVNVQRLARAAVAAAVAAVGVVHAGVKPASAGNPVALGAYISDPSLGGTAPGTAAAMDNYAKLVGRMPAVIMWYQNWGNYWNIFSTSDFNAVIARGAIPELVWEPWNGVNPDPKYKLTNIVNGNFDSYIYAWARAAKAWGHPFYLRFAHEMNGNWYPWGTAPNNSEHNVPSDYVAAWRHVRNIFAAVGANNAIWLWTPNKGGDSSETPYAQDFPGDNYVDRVGFDAYNRGPLYPDGKWKSLAELWSTAYTTLVSLSSKPIMVGETSSVEKDGSKAAWITQGFLTTIPTMFPRITEVSWFNSVNTNGTDWRVNSSASSLSAWKQVVASPLFHGTQG